MDEAIPILRVASASSALAWYQRIGWREEWVHRFAKDQPAFMSIARDGAARLFLSEHDGDAVPGTLTYIVVTDVDEIASALGLAVNGIIAVRSSASLTGIRNRAGVQEPSILNTYGPRSVPRSRRPGGGHTSPSRGLRPDGGRWF